MSRSTSTCEPEAKPSAVVRTEVNAATASLAHYLATVQSFPRQLPQQEERDLAQAMAAGSESARVALFEAHLWWAAKLARGYARGGVPYEDMVQVANMALWRVLPGFDVQRRYRVTTYVTEPILCDLRIASGQFAAHIRRPRRIVARERKLDRLLRASLAETGHAPSADLIAEVLGVPVAVAAAVIAGREAQPVVLSLDALAAGEWREWREWRGPEGRMARVAAAAANGSRLDHVADAGNMIDHLEDEVAAREAAEAMLAAVAAANLTPKQRQVVYLVYEEDMSLPQAARQMQITHQAAWMHHARALRRIRHAHEQLNHEELNREGG